MQPNMKEYNKPLRIVSMLDMALNFDIAVQIDNEFNNTYPLNSAYNHNMEFSFVDVSYTITKNKTEKLLLQG